MASRKVSVNMSRARSSMKSSKKTIESSHNVSHDEVVSIEDLKAKNVRECKHVPGEEKMDYSWFLKDKYQANPDSIHLYCVTFCISEKRISLIRIIVRYLFGSN